MKASTQTTMTSIVIEQVLRVIRRVMQLIKGVGNLEIIGWTVFSILSCFVVAFPLSYFFELDVDWRIPQGGKYADYEKVLEGRAYVLRDAFERLHSAVSGQGAKNFVLPYFTPEVHCPHLVPVGGRKLCAPWMFDTPVLLNRIDNEQWKETKKRRVLKKAKKQEESGLEGAGCRAYSLHSHGEQKEEDREWKEALGGCIFDTNDGVMLTATLGHHALYVSAKDMDPIRPAEVRAANVCQLVVDMPTNLAQTVRNLRKFGENGYRIMSYEKIDSITARFSFIWRNCTDHFGAKYIKKYLV